VLQLTWDACAVAVKVIGSSVMVISAVAVAYMKSLSVVSIVINEVIYAVIAALENLTSVKIDSGRVVARVTVTVWAGTWNRSADFADI